MDTKKISFNEKYLTLNELINSVTHGLGAVLSVAGLVFLLILAKNHGNIWHIVSFSVFGASMILLYTASTLYHSVRKENIKKLFQKFDHSAIYILIAGTYTPFTLLILQGVWGWTIFSIVWVLAIAGVIFQVFFYKDKYRLISAIIYLMMGWLFVIAYNPMMKNISDKSLLWLVIGGLSYSIGVIFYLWRKLPFNHGIWHLFVLGGTVGHFISIYFDVIK